MQDFIDELMILLLKNTSNHTVFVEVLGIIGNLNIPDFDFAKLAQAYSMVDLVQRKLTSAVADDSHRVAASHKKSTAKKRNDDEAAERAGEGLSEDDDVTLEVIVLLGTMAHDENIAPMVAKTDTIRLLMELMIIKEGDDEIKPANTANEIDEEWIKKIKHQKFQWHNSEYLSIMAELLDQHAEEEERKAHRRQSSKLLGLSLGNEELATRKVAIGNTTYYAGLDNTDDDSDNEEEFERQIGGTSAILDGP
ncbi:Kinesin-associated protein 3 [Physocladia obscura]|uniref:Kinesin-associated protein 3 n=1 Tax=Physocladia obscura TaxID=109957 RepID=A0AAD5SQ01_9FUNG|nr:Kinesin-associated protein 3 [Physocladia obscura]